MDIVSVQVLNWEKFNPRKDVVASSWFRLSHNLFEDSDFYDFSHAELCCWIYILSQASKKNSGAIRLNFAHAQRVGRLSKSDINSALNKLQIIQCVHLDVTQTLRERDVENRERIATNERDETNGRTNKCSELENPNSRAHEDYASLKEIFESRKVKYETQCSWREAFPDSPWVIQEVRKAIAWEQANPKRRKKDFSRFMANWLIRNWDQRKNIPSLTQVSEKTFSPEQQKQLDYYQSLRRTS